MIKSYKKVSILIPSFSLILGIDIDFVDKKAIFVIGKSTFLLIFGLDTDLLKSLILQIMKTG